MKKITISEELVLLDKKGNEIIRIKDEGVCPILGINNTFVKNMMDKYKANSARLEITYK